MYDVSSITVVRAINDPLPKMAILSANKEKEPSLHVQRKHKLVEFSDIELFNAKRW